MLNKKLAGNLQAISLADVVSQFSINRFSQLKWFIAVITSLAVVVGFLVVFLSMYTAVVERTREIGSPPAIPIGAWIMPRFSRQALPFGGEAVGGLRSIAQPGLWCVGIHLR